MQPIYRVKIRLGDLRSLIREYITDRINVANYFETDRDAEYINKYGPLAGPGNDEPEDNHMLRHLGDDLTDDEDEFDFGPVPPSSSEQLYASLDPYVKNW